MQRPRSYQAARTCGPFALEDAYATTIGDVQRWTAEIAERPAVKRGRMVNRMHGDPSEQLHERHDAFRLRNEDAGQYRLKDRRKRLLQLGSRLSAGVLLVRPPSFSTRLRGPVRPRQRSRGFLLPESGGSISFEDYAIALADEIEKPQHLKQRFAVGYSVLGGRAERRTDAVSPHASSAQRIASQALNRSIEVSRLIGGSASSHR
jgi:hypothetical protein